jgi:hypothetical protein
MSEHSSDDTTVIPNARIKGAIRDVQKANLPAGL